MVGAASEEGRMNFVVVEDSAVNMDHIVALRYEPMSNELVFMMTNRTFRCTPTKYELQDLQIKLGVMLDYGKN